MRNIALKLIALCSVPLLLGCTWDSVQKSVLASVYSSFGDGYSGDRLSDFDQRYEEQRQAAAEYYDQR
jgi:hypothetical protein